MAIKVSGDDVMYIRADIHEAEIEAVKSKLADTRRMLLWIRNHYDIDMSHASMHKKMKAQVLERVDKLIPSDCSAPDYSDIPHKGITV